MVQVRGYSEDDVDVLIDEFELIVQTAITRTLTRTSAQLQPAIIGASSAGLGPDDIATITAHWQEEIDGVLTPYIGQVYTGSAVQAAVGLADGFPDDVLPGIPLVADEYALTYMKTVSNRLVGVGDELWEDVRNELLDGVKQGKSIEQIAARIAHVAQFDLTRAKTIARTEIHSAAESGSISQLKFVGYGKGEVTKTWEYTHDLRTRLTHQTTQTVDLEEKFIIGGYHLDYPGDPSGPAGEIINCRCTTLFDIEKAPELRCGGLVAATAATSGVCVVPTTKTDTSHIAAELKKAIFQAFMSHKITPAWGGAKIHKVLLAVRASENLDPGVTDWHILSVVDELYTSKKDTFTSKYTTWFQSPAGKKVVGLAPPPPKAVTSPIAAPPAPPAPAPAPTVVAPVPGAADLGDISTFDYFFKQDVLEMWQSMGGGKKVTPGHGGAKIYKQLQQLKHDLNDQLALNGLPPVTDLQILRILDDAGGFSGKPKTYESVVVDWLASPAGNQYVTNVYVKTQVKLDPSLDPQMKVIPPSGPMPVVPPSVSVADDAANVIALHDDKNPFGLWAEASKYDDGDVIGYAKTDNGDTLKAVKSTTNGYPTVTVYVRKDSKGDATWHHDAVHTNPHSIQSEYNYKTPLWSLKPPPTAPAATKIPGKFPNDIVTLDEIAASKYEWEKDDIVATTTNAGLLNFRIRANGHSGFYVEVEDPAKKGTWVKQSLTYSNGNDITQLAHVSQDWTLGPDALTVSKKAESTIAGKSPGEVLTADEIFGGSSSYDVVLAYAVDPATGWLQRIRRDATGQLIVEVQESGKAHWSFNSYINYKHDAEFQVTGLGKTWYAASTGHKMHVVPDQVKVQLAGKTVPGVATQSKITGYNVGDLVPDNHVWNAQYNAGIVPGDVIATGTSPAGIQWRIVYQTDDTLHMERYNTLLGGWQDQGSWYPSTPSAINTGVTDWFATADQITPHAPVSVKQAAKKVTKKATPPPPPTPIPTPHPPSPPLTPKKLQLGTSSLTGTNKTHISTKKVGDSADGDEIFSNYSQYAEGQIIATKKSWQGEFRVLVADGQLIVQKKTSAGMWTGTKVASSKWSLPAQNGWELKNDFVTLANYKSIMKKVSPTHAQAANVAKVAKKVAKVAASLQAKVTKIPDSAASADISGLTDAQQAQIFTDFKASSKGQLLSSSDEDVLANMWALSEKLALGDPVFRDLTVLQVARAVDAQLAKSLGKTDQHLFEAKVKSFLSSPSGQNYISSGNYLANPIVQEVFQFDIDLPPGVVLAAGERVQPVPGPGPFDPTKPSTSFRSTTAAEQQVIQDRMLRGRSWTAKEREGLRTYTSGAYYSYNGYLRQRAGYAKADASTRSKVVQAQAGMRPIDEDILVLRGTGWEQFPAGYHSEAGVRRLIGRTITDPAFLSTSTAREFGGFGGAVKLEVEVPRGTMVAYVKSISHNRKENEIIIAAGSKYQIVDVRPGHPIVVRLRVVS